MSISVLIFKSSSTNSQDSVDSEFALSEWLHSSEDYMQCWDQITKKSSR
jgi:hypothetical protein